ncbi:Alpha-mannosidase [Austwickia chelonae]|uniref:Putative alpha-mannosidase n=1 Tax=Austwickia chelonae NBRC 105200 TaxID=1184607 RepID=K6V496_9MICO|nr:glycoside hydrolase family 38 C-terminal domain-containing protein [Austwickia chelonae]GAB76968.1 putative alpha-mannosidase [Austwickia chelonae NBRC 105200]SEW32840.1 Alpha-mannosidase [Austwickia chelonae]
MTAVALASARSTWCFVSTPDGAAQVVQAELDAPAPAAARLQVRGEGVSGAVEIAAGDGPRIDIPVEVDSRYEVGMRVPVTVTLTAEDAPEAYDPDRSVQEIDLEIAEPGWTMTLVNHFHYDPVWWNTQSAYTDTGELLGDDGTTRRIWEHNGIELVLNHLAKACEDPDYCFVLAEVDYLKPFWDTHPAERETVRRLLAEGRLEIMGGTYNEPSTNLISSETTIRNFVYGRGYQRDIMGATPNTAWQLDVFGHDPQFPGLAADSGLTSTAWARGPHHQWGPGSTGWKTEDGDIRNMQFPAEFEWISPSGRGVTTHYMPAHYSAGWWMDSSATLQEAEDECYKIFVDLASVASTKHTMLPVGTDYTPPNKWVTEIHRDWNSRYVSPKFVCGLPRDFFAAVQEELDSREIAPTPQTRDMNPIYTGKDVSYIDTKQAQRATEVAATDAEKLATFAESHGLGSYPHAAMDKVWRQLAYGSHHDAITGSESDQVYLDLVHGWREAHDLASDVRDQALQVLLGAVDTSGEGQALVVVNTLAHTRTDLARVTLTLPEDTGLRILDEEGAEVPFVVESREESTGQTVVAFVARDVPGIGHRTWRIDQVQAPLPRWAVAEDRTSGQDADASTPTLPTISSEIFEIVADPQQGGALTSIVDRRTGRRMLQDGGLGAELRLYREYDAHPHFGEGPWHLLPTGNVTSSAERPAVVRVESSPAGERLIATGRVGTVDYEQTTTCWRGLDRVDFSTRVVRFEGRDQLLRVKFAGDIPGGRAFSDIAGAVVGRPFAFPEVDSAESPWTLDHPAHTVFGLGSTAKVALHDLEGSPVGDLSIAIAEVVTPDLEQAAPVARDLVVALARVGVTATTTVADGNRYGWSHADSNLPDVRIVLGGPGRNSLAARILEGLPEAGELARQVAEHGHGRVFVPAEESVEDSWKPRADLRGPRALPVVILDADGDLAEALRVETAELVAGFAADASIGVPCLSAGSTKLLDDQTMAIASYGIPGFAVSPEGGLHLSLMRSCSGWPAGVWLDPPVRRLPDGSSFQLQHWTHEFDYCLFAGAGDWRTGHIAHRGQEWSTPFLTRVESAHDGSIPARHAFLSVAPEGAVHVQAVKPRGNALACGAARPSGAEEGITVRLSALSGEPVEATVRLDRPWSQTLEVDLHEDPIPDCPDPGLAEDGRVVRLPMEGSQIRTIMGIPAQSAPICDDLLGPAGEPVQPVYARYWLHNRGAAPMGFLPVSLTCTPTVLRAEDGGRVTTELRLASQLVDASVASTVEVGLPEGWSCLSGEGAVDLPPGGHLVRPLELDVPADAPAGLHLVEVRARFGEDVLEEILTVAVGDVGELLPAPPGPEIDHQIQIEGLPRTTGRPTGLTVVSMTEEVVLRPGDSRSVEVVLRNDLRSAVHGEAVPVSPWGTWGLVGPAAQPFTVDPGATTTVRFDVDTDAHSRSGNWWMTVKLMWAGRVQYTRVLPVVVDAG